MKILVVCCALLASSQFVAAKGKTDTLRKDLDHLQRLTFRMSNVFDDIMRHIPPRDDEESNFVPHIPMVPVDPIGPVVGPSRPEVDPTGPGVDPVGPEVDPTESDVDPTESEVDPTRPEVDPTGPRSERMITSPSLSVQWDEVTLTWEGPEGAVGYKAELLTEDGTMPAIRLRRSETSFTTTDIETYYDYRIRITPILFRGTGVAYTTDFFMPACRIGCPRIYAPVCGTDGSTFGNACELDATRCQLRDKSGTLAIAYEGECDECAFVACDVPRCPEGFILGTDPLPGECCVGCVDVCTEVVCDPPTCPEGFTLGTDPLPGQCCVGCVDVCSLVACDVPRCPDGFTLGTDPLPGECCVGCVDVCSLVKCPELSCGPNGYTEDVEGECCPRCIQLAEIGSPSLNVQWNEVTLTWTRPDDVIGYEVTLITVDGVRPTIRLGPTETSFTTTAIQPNLRYNIRVVPIMAEGEGAVYTTESFIPECPFVCPLIFDPLCGTDGRTYGNRCQLEVAQCELGDRESNILELDYEGECDPCARIECDAPQCPEGFVLGDAPLPDECCPGCVDECSTIVCPDITCAPGEATSNFAGECCPLCAPVFYRDCSDALALGMTDSGVYTIRPEGMDTPVDVYCDMVTDGGGWIVILRRVNSTVSFFRPYEDYVMGFGELEGAHWVGLEPLHHLGRQGNGQLLITMTDRLGTTATGSYSNFEVGPEEDEYRLKSASGYTGTIGNALSFNRGAAFSARDLDLDRSDRDCAASLGGGWWYKGNMCTRCNPMGEYLVYPNFGYEKGVFWAPFRGKQNSLPFLEMKIRPAL